MNAQQASRPYRRRWALFNALALWAIAAVSAPSSAAAPLFVVALGDSLTAGYGLPPDQSFPVKLQAWLLAHGVEAELINAGLSGDTSAGGLARLDWALADRHDAVLVELGANDALRGIDPKITYDNLDQILTRLEAKKLKAMLLGMRAPANWGPDYQRQFDAIYPDLAKKHGVPLYPFFLEGVALQADLIQADRIHPNAKGVDAVVGRVGPYVLHFLKPDAPNIGSARMGGG